MSFESWKTINALDYCKKIADGTHDSPKRKEKGKPLITSKHIKGKSIDFGSAYLISEDDFNKINQRSRVDQWDVLISMIGEYCGYCYVEANEKVDYAVKNVGIFKVGDRVKAYWLYYYLSSPIGKEILSSLRSGTSQPYISLGALRSLSIQVPYKEETMLKIVSILSTIDDKIELNRQTNQTLEAIAQSLFKEWFVEFNFPGGTGKQPTNWNNGKLHELIELNPKLTIKRGRPAKYVEMKDLSEGSATINNYVQREFTSGSKFQNGDTLLARITPCLENGKTGLVSFLEDGEVGWGSTEFIVMRGKQLFSTYFVYCLARHIPFREFAIKSMVGSSGRQRVVENILADFSFTIPSDEALKKFNSVVEPLFLTMKNHQEQIKTLTLLRNTLLPKLLKGEISINHNYPIYECTNY